MYEKIHYVVDADNIVEAVEAVIRLSNRVIIDAQCDFPAMQELCERYGAEYRQDGVTLVESQPLRRLARGNAQNLGEAVQNFGKSGKLLIEKVGNFDMIFRVLPEFKTEKIIEQPAAQCGQKEE